MAAMICKRPPHRGQYSISISNTRLRRRAQLMRAGEPCACSAGLSVARCAGLGTIAARNAAWGASTPWKRIRCSRGRRHQCGEPLHELQRRHDDVGGPVAVGTLELQHDLARAIAFEPFVGNGEAGDSAAQAFKLLALMGGTAHPACALKAVRVDAARLRGIGGSVGDGLQGGANPAPLTGEGHQLLLRATRVQRRRRKPWARMPHSRKASNSSLTKSGKLAPVSASTWAKKVSKCSWTT